MSRTVEVLMRARTGRSPFYAAGLTAIAAAALAGCAAGSSGAGATGATGYAPHTAAPSSPLDAVQLAAKTTGRANSFTGTMSVQATAKAGASSSGNVSMTASMAEQLRP